MSNFKTWLPLPEAERPGKDDELMFGSLVEALDRARRRAERKGVRQRVRVWATSHTKTAFGYARQYNYYALQDVDA